MSYVIVSVISLFIGGAVGVATLSLCIAGKNAEIQEKENDCYGCFGVSLDNCDHCPKCQRNEGDEDEK
ncbi:hypothetical protein [uncultured Eubacterium sp.]|jgi:hypothetical protein|uniref:hypothetical protein n=1 Tax=uncultured Eubacterium sp. TaxID=165185 RepID=UPI00260FB933|nr:hypothetical protein [uncultured Eubacterium sp.]